MNKKILLNYFVICCFGNRMIKKNNQWKVKKKKTCVLLYWSSDMNQYNTCEQSPLWMTKVLTAFIWKCWMQNNISKRCVQEKKLVISMINWWTYETNMILIGYYWQFISILHNCSYINGLLKCTWVFIISISAVNLGLFLKFMWVKKDKVHSTTFLRENVVGS